MRLKNKIALITGGASGLGLATTERFVAEGCRVLVTDIQEEQGEELSARFGNDVLFRRCDVTREEEIEAAFDYAENEMGPVDAVFHSAGIIGAVGPITTTPGDEWRFSIDILLNGTFYAMKHAARVMIPRKRGSIISMASTAGLMGGLGPHAYAAAKHGVVGLTKNVAAELAGNGIRVNSVAATGMATPMVAVSLTGDPSKIEEAKKTLADTSPLKGRPGLAEDVANAVLWLASDESGYTTGHTLTTDAGLTVGATPEGPAFADYQPLFREGGKRGLETS